jgi:hypothetical protein
VNPKSRFEFQVLIFPLSSAQNAASLMNSGRAQPGTDLYDKREACLPNNERNAYHPESFGVFDHLSSGQLYY